uniref:hypothetical protein n=1 Tax=Gelidibacter sp. TaxID=2018083 RepID=UPI00404A2D95
MLWTVTPDKIENTLFINKPNIYIIQPDGYVAQNVLENEPYNYSSDLYDWLNQSSFKIYHDFRSNYPASLTSNASMFAMKQHYFNDAIFPTFELPNARGIITGNNSAIATLKHNDYKTYFVVEDEYFQQNRNPLIYDYYNINLDEIPFFSNDNNVKKVVFNDLKKAMNDKTNQTKFFFIEKLLPHHIHFKKSLEKDRNQYINRIDSVNVWLKKTVDYVIENDEKSLIIILADHGGWLGVKHYDDMFTTTEVSKIKSIYSTIAAIRWNGYLMEGYDTNLKTNVNLFRVLFSSLSENSSHLKYLENDSSYNLHKENFFYNSVYQVIDNNGNVNFEKQ